MPKDPPVNTGDPDDGDEPFVRVSEMQVKLHRWAVTDHGRRFDDLFNFVYDPPTLLVAFARVLGNTGARTCGDGRRKIAEGARSYLGRRLDDDVLAAGISFECVN